MPRKFKAFEKIEQGTRRKRQQGQQAESVVQSDDNTKTTSVDSSAITLASPSTTLVSPSTSYISQALTESTSTNSLEINTAYAEVIQATPTIVSNAQDEFFDDEEILEFVKGLSLADQRLEVEDSSSSQIRQSEVFAKAEDYSEENIEKETGHLSFSDSSSETTILGSPSDKHDTPEELSAETPGSDSLSSSGFEILGGASSTFFKTPSSSTLSKEPLQDSVNNIYKIKLEELSFKGPTGHVDDYKEDFNKFREVSSHSNFIIPVSSPDGNFYERDLLQKWYDAGYHYYPEQPDLVLDNPANLPIDENIQNLFQETISADNNNNNETTKFGSFTPSYKI